MTWHLKDRELEKVFEAYSGGNFVNALNYSIENENIDSDFIVYVEFGREFLGPDFAENCLCFRTDELEEVCEYNPHGWNEYPNVIPPEGVLMRVECENNLHTALVYKNNRWQFESGENFQGFERIYKVRRYRPWNED